jgi:hypothetical protein
MVLDELEYNLEMLPPPGMWAVGREDFREILLKEIEVLERIIWRIKYE